MREVAQGTCRSTTIPGHLSPCLSGWSASLLSALEALAERPEAPAFHAWAATEPTRPQRHSAWARWESRASDNPEPHKGGAACSQSHRSRRQGWCVAQSCQLISRVVLEVLLFSASVHHLRDERNPFLGPLSADHCVDTLWKRRGCPQEEVLGLGAASKGHQGWPLPGVLHSDAPRVG